MIYCAFTVIHYTVTETLHREGIDICCIQETGVLQGYPEELLNCNNFVLELEMNDTKKRTGIYLNKNLKYKRRRDLEKINMHVVVVDIIGHQSIRIISLYRSFRPVDLSPSVFFESQLEILENAQCRGCYILGDFNLDSGMDSRPD